MGECLLSNSDYVLSTITVPIKSMLGGRILISLPLHESGDEVATDD